MNFFNRVINMFTVRENLSEHWVVPSTEEDLKPIFDKGSGTHLIYKHSNACMTCVFVKRSLDAVVPNFREHVTCHYIDVRHSRPLSNFVRELSGIKHESPQVILVHNGQVSWHASHGAIDEQILTDQLNAING